jgi:hypothetical protein
VGTLTAMPSRYATPPATIASARFAPAGSNGCGAAAGHTFTPTSLSGSFAAEPARVTDQIQRCAASGPVTATGSRPSSRMSRAPVAGTVTLTLPSATGNGEPVSRSHA